MARNSAWFFQNILTWRCHCFIGRYLLYVCCCMEFGILSQCIEFRLTSCKISISLISSSQIIVWYSKSSSWVSASICLVSYIQLIEILHHSLLIQTLIMSSLFTRSHWDFTMHHSIRSTTWGWLGRICNHTAGWCCRGRWLLVLLVHLIVLRIFDWSCWCKICSWIVHWIFGLPAWLCSAWWTWNLSWRLGLLWIIGVYNDLTCKFWTHSSLMLTRSNLILVSITVS